MRKEFLTFGKPNIGEEEIAEVVDTLRSGWIGTGPKVGIFEDAFKQYIGADFAIAVSSCTAALHLAMLVSGVEEGDEVITSPMTFCATANAIVHTGAKPVFVDVDRNTMNLNPQLLEDAITPQTKAIVPVHFAGRPCDMDAINEISTKHNLVVIEDAAHALESSIGTRKIGTLSDATCFSFYVTKSLVTAEGGMITTNNEEWVDSLKMYALHGMDRDAWKRYSDQGFKHYSVEFPGFKYNMTDIQASIGLHQIKRVESHLKARIEQWKVYDEAFAELTFTKPCIPKFEDTHARHLYTILIDEKRDGMSRDQFQSTLHSLNIGTGIHYTAVHLHPYYAKKWGYRRGDFPEAEYISDRTLSLPLGGHLNLGGLSDVVEAVLDISRKS